MATDRKFNVRHGLSAGTGATQKDVVDNVGKVIDVGTLSTLKTAAKDNTVNAINEIYDDLSTLSLIEETFEPMGIADRSHTVISFDNGTRTFTIAPAPGQTEYVVWVKSVKFTFTTAKTVSLGSSPSTGLYYIYFDTNGDLQYRSAYFDWDSDAMVAYVYWNASTSSAPFVADERHGITMDWATHEYLHRTRGAVIANGFDIYNYSTTGDGSADADAQLDIANGTFFDEDLEIAITHSATPTIGTFTQVLQGNAEIPVFYHSGSTGAWVKDAPTTFPAKQSGTTLQYNSFSGGAWTTIPASNNLYVVSWIVATNDITTPIIALLGQAQYSNIGNAEEATFSALDLTNFPVVEFRPLWKVIFRTSSGYPNTPNAYIAGVTDLRQLIETGGEGELVSDHGGLTGLLDDDHPQYIHVTETRAGVTAEFNTTGKITTTNSIGIGTTNPSTKLSVNGYITESTDSGSTYWNVVTQSDIGYGAAQVPLNQYLGQLAFLDDYHPNGLRRDGGGSDDVFIDSNGGLNVTGASTFGGNVNLDDNVKATFGDDGDLEIYHNGTNSVIGDNGTGNLLITGDSEVSILNSAFSEYKAKFITNGAVELYYDNSKKFETTGAGATVFGTLETQQLNVSGVVTATSFVGDGSNITGISTLNIVDYGVGLGGGGGGSGDSYWISNSAGIHTLSSVGIGTTNPNAVVTVDNTGVLAAGIVTAYKFYGDGSNITGISAVARVTVSQTAPPSPTEGDLWYHSTQARLFVYYTDTDSSQWIDAAPFNGGSGGSGASVSIGATAPTGPYAGDLWYNSDYGRLFIYYSDEDSQQWVDAAPFNFTGITTATYSENSFVATAGQTSFDVSYEVGYVDVFLNGIRLSSSEYTAVTGSTVVLDDPATEGDVVDIIEVATNRGQTGPRGAKGDTGASTRTAYSYTASASQTTFSATYTVGFVDVFLNGIKLTESEYTATDGSTVVLDDAATEGDIIEIIGYETISLTQVAVSSDTSPSLGGNLDLNSYNITGTGNINIVGVITATDFNSTSDINLKTNIKAIDDPLAKVIQLNGVSFDWKHMQESSAGVIAQDVEKVLPEIVRNNEDGYKSLNYNGLIGLLIEAVKEQNETIKTLEQKINSLEERLN